MFWQNITFYLEFFTLKNKFDSIRIKSSPRNSLMSTSNYSISMRFSIYSYKAKLLKTKIKCPNFLCFTGIHLFHLEKQQQHISYCFILFLESSSKLSFSLSLSVSKQSDFAQTLLHCHHYFHLLSKQHK